MLNSLKKFVNLSISKLRKTGFFHVFGSTVISKLITFLSGIILIRVVSKADYGVYTYSHNIYSFFILVSGLGMTSATLQLCSEKADEQMRLNLYSYCSKAGMKFNAFLALVILTVAVFVDIPIKGANILLAAFSFLPLLKFPMEQQQMWLRTGLKNREFSYANTFFAFFTLLFSVILAVMLGSLGLIMASYLAAVATIIFQTVRFKVPLVSKNAELNREAKRNLWGVSSISMLNNGLSKLMCLLDIFVIGLFIPDEIVIASYKVATTIPEGLSFIPHSIILYAYPYFARNKDNKDWTIRKYKQLTLASGAVNFFAALVLILFSSFIVPLIFGKQYTDAIPCFVILCISFAISGTFSDPAGNLLVTQRKLKFNLFMGVFSGAFNTCMNVILVLKWGSIGASIATLLTVLLTSIFNTGYLLHVYRRIPQ